MSDFRLENYEDDPLFTRRLTFEYHSTSSVMHFLAINNDGEVKKQTDCTDLCYAKIFKSNGLQADRLFQFFPHQKWEKNLEGHEAWCHWVINDSPMAEAFITKSVEEGKALGFELDTHQPRMFMQAGMSLLRHSFERPNWNWYEFKGMGYSDQEALALSLNVCSCVLGSEKVLYTSVGLMEHQILPTQQTFESYGLEMVLNDKQRSETLAGGFSGYTSKGMWDSFVRKPLNKFFYREDFPDTIMHHDAWGDVEYYPKLNKENLDFVLKALKGEE